VSHPAKVKTDAAYPLPEDMRAWVLGNPGQLSLVDKPIPMPGRRGAGAHRCRGDLRD
jgi:L-iditol 2-dehydrogenase